MNAFWIVNRQIPDNDYRLNYGRLSQRFTITYGLPGKPASLEPTKYVYMGFEESIRLADVSHYVNLFRYLKCFSSHYQLVHFFSTSLMLFGPIVPDRWPAAACALYNAAV